eukprot:08417_5
MGNAADDDDEGDEQGNGGSMSEDEEMEEEGDTLGEQASARALPPALPAGKGKGVLRKQLSPRKAAAAEGVLANTPQHAVFAQHFKQAWCAMTRKTDAEYHKELLKMKGPGEDDVTFEIHEMYWSVQSFGGSSQLKKWKLAANDMVMRKTGKPCVPVPGRGYGYMPKAWDKWCLREYELV